ncbi:sugar nucleotide-binding protein [Paenibacillus rhizoplanae]
MGVLNQFAERDRIGAYHVNGFLPHRLRRAADQIHARLIHISSDCVFEGTRGGYTEEDAADGTSVYALTKKSWRSARSRTSHDPYLHYRARDPLRRNRPHGMVPGPEGPGNRI